MIEQYSRQAGYMVEEGASPQQVDRAIEKFGFAMGPFRMSDLAGNDVGWYIRKRRYVERPDMKYPKIADKICELGRFGQKTGAGFYRYEPGKRDAIPDPIVDKLIDEHRKEIGVTPRKLSDDEIVHRLVFALVNEGAKILDEGIAMRASDIDMIYLTGYGFPVVPRRADAVRRHVRPVQRGQPDAGLRREPARRPVVLDAGAAAGKAGGRRQIVQRLMRRLQADRSEQDKEFSSCVKQ
jgi:hypothetical protein